MPAANEPLPSAEDQWFTRDPDEPLPPHERMISEARAVEEALARLGPTASNEAIQQDLERVGVRLGLGRVAAIRAELHGEAPPRAAVAPALSPSELVRTEGEAAPPPGAPQTGTTAGPAPGREESPARPSDLVKTEGETVPPPRR